MTGTLGLFSLVDLFQLLAASSRSGRLTVDHPEGQARVYFEEGLAVHAEFAGRSGEEAVFALFADEQGSFEFMLGVPAPQTSITSRTENLVLEASRRLDESRRGEVDGRGPFGEPLNEAEAGHRALPPRRPLQPNDQGASAEAQAVSGNPGTVAPASAATGALSEEPELPGEAAAGALSEEPELPGEAAAPEPTAGPTLGAKPEARGGRTDATESEADRRAAREADAVRETARVAGVDQPSSAEAAMTTTGSGSGVTLTAIPAFAEKAKTVADMSLSKEEVEFLRAVDGKRNVGQAAQEAAVAGERARAIVERFVELGVLRLTNRKPRTARLVTHLTRTRLPHGIVGVDPSIMSAWERSLGYPAQSIACRREDGRVCLLGAMPLDNAGPYLMINRETLMHADLAVNQPLLVKPVPQNEV